MKSPAMSICPKCAWFKVQSNCKYCNIPMIITETTLEDVMGISNREEEALIEHYIETLIKDTYDPKVREYREEQEANEEGFVYESMPTCPTCGSTNVERISIGQKVMGGALFGLFSSNVRNTMHCRHCGAKW